MPPFDISKLIEMAPLIVGALKPGSPEAAAMMRGFMRSRQQLEQQGIQQQQIGRQDELHQAQMGNLQADNTRAQQQLELSRLGSFRSALEPFRESVTEPDLSGMEQAYGVPAGIGQTMLPPMSTRKKKRAQEIYERAVKTYGDEAVASDAITIQTGPDLFGDVKPSQLRSLFAEAAVGPEGQPAQPYVKPPSAGTETERAAQLLEKISGAKAAGDAGVAAKAQAQYDALIEAKRDIGRADDRPVDAGMADLNRQLADLRVQGETQKVEGERAKQAEATRATTSKRTAATQLADEMTGVIDELLDPSGRLTPGAQTIVGLRVPFASVVPESPAADAQAALDRLTGTLVVDLMREMKEQSRTGATGFGQLSERELALLQSAASKLTNRNMSERAFAAELKRIRDKVQRIYADTASAPRDGSADDALSILEQRRRKRQQ